jgi:outer membrane protein TolC
MVLAVCATLVVVPLAGAEGDAPGGVSATDTRFMNVTPGKSVSLADALRLADLNNLSVAVAREDIVKAQAKLKAAWSALLPRASGGLTFTHNDHPDYVGLGTQSLIARRQDDLAANLMVELPLVDVRSFLGISLAKLSGQVAELSFEKLRQALLLSVAQAYFQSLSARSLVDVHKSQQDSLRKHLAVASIRHRSGTGSRLDVIRAQTDLLTANEDIVAAVAALENSRDALAVLMGVEGLPMPEQVPALNPPVGSASELASRARKRREDLRLARTSVRLADKDLTTSWMQFLPSLYGSWQFSYQVTEPSSLRSEDKSRWFYAITLSVPLYDHTRYADLDEKRAALRSAELQAKDAEQKALLEVRSARRDYEKAMAQVATAAKKALLAAQALTLSESAYENGTGNSLDVTDAFRAKRAAEIDLAVKRFESQMALLSLLRSVGGDISRIGSE